MSRRRESAYQRRQQRRRVLRRAFARRVRRLERGVDRVIMQVLDDRGRQVQTLDGMHRNVIDGLSTARHALLLALRHM